MTSADPLRARIAGLGVGGALGCAVATGVACQVVVAPPAATLLAAERYRELFTGHSVLGLVWVCVVVVVALALLAAPRPWSAALWWLAVAAFGACALPLGMALVAGWAPFSIATSIPPGMAMGPPLVASGLVAIIAAATRDRRRGPSALGLTLGAGGVTTALSGALVLTRAPLSTLGIGWEQVLPGGHALVDVALIVAMAALAEPRVESRAGAGLRRLLAVHAAAAALPLVMTTAATIVRLALAPAWLAVLVLVARRIARADAPWLARVAAWTALALHVEASVLRFPLVTVAADVHLHDTLFATAALHAEAFALLSVLAAVLLDGREIPVRARRAAALALGASVATYHAWLGTELALGSRGMPRRFVEHLEVFDAHFVAAAIAAVALAVALAWLALQLSRLERAAPKVDATELARVFADEQGAADGRDRT